MSADSFLFVIKGLSVQCKTFFLLKEIGFKNILLEEI